MAMGARQQPLRPDVPMSRTRNRPILRIHNDRLHIDHDHDVHSANLRRDVHLLVGSIGVEVGTERRQLLGSHELRLRAAVV